MHEKCVEFIVEYCRNICPNWSHCIATALGFDKGDENDKRDLFFCLKSVENPDKTEDQIEQEISQLTF
jgi:hypothetical protein